MRRLLTLAAFLILPSWAFAQGVRVDNPGGPAQKIVQGFVSPIPGATITVCTSSATGTPCTPLVPTSPVTLCTDSTCSTAAPNPFTADSGGNYGFWAVPGTYKVSITAPGVTGSLLTVTLPCAAGVSCVSTSGNNAFTGNNTHSGTETFNAVIALPNTTSASAGVITIGGAQFIHNFATNPATAENAFIGAGAGNFTLTGVLNTAVGSPALNGLTSGNSNSAFGAASMSSNTSGGGNAAFGDSSLTANTTGISNAAFGHFVMKASTTAQNNSAFGNTALSSLVGGTTTNNSAFGAAALLSLTTGTNNNGFGVDALRSLTTGSNNMAFGVGNGTGPGANYTGAESNNIVIGNSGTVGESGAIRIGTPSIQLETYLINPTAVGAVPTLTGTGACATITTQHGGSWAGDAKCTGTTGASTLTITPGITAANGWVCHVQDETTRANLFQQTSHSPTSCTLTVTSVTQNDVFVFSAIAY